MKWISRELFSKLESQKTTAFRLASGYDGWVERFGNDVLWSYSEVEDLEREKNEILCELKKFSSFNLSRLFVRHLINNPKEDNKPELLHGESNLPLQTTASENGLSFGIDFDSSYSVGLFMDQRNNRTFMREHKPKSILNLFCYTGAFSIAAAHEGAKTTSIDLSKKSIERAKENFTLNNLSTDGHFFYVDDVLKSLPRQQKRGATFDCIILDPPTFSRSKETGVFRVEKEMSGMIKICLSLLNNKGRLLISTNCTELALQDLSRMAVNASRELGIKIHFKETDMPEDFSDEHMPRTIWVQVT